MSFPTLLIIIDILHSPTKSKTSKKTVIVGEPNLFDKCLVENSKTIKMKFTKKSNPTYNKKAASREKQTLSRPRDDSSFNMTQTVALSQNESQSPDKIAPDVIEKDSMLAEIHEDLKFYDTYHGEVPEIQTESNQTRIQDFTEKSKIDLVEKLQKNSNQTNPIKNDVKTSNKQKRSALTKRQSLSNNAIKKSRSNLKSKSQKNVHSRFVI